MSALVLVADPDPFNLRLLHEACEAAGYDVVTAADGPDVLAMVARHPPD
jgi:CheY-like chemotaxis protein